MTEKQSQTERIIDIDLSSEMQESFLEYSYSVIYARALPDARDGLKPVHRRIIYQMGEMGLRPDRGHVKSARVTGEVMGKLHPHGDGAIYDALVRMAQPFSLRMPLIDGHGNFGSLDDGPAAARYTEARLSDASMLMNEGLDEDVVDFKPNYDAQLTEPEVLPAAFPNLLVNGSSGIAVGMATNMPPHNLREVISAARYLLDNPQATLDDLMRHLPGPDLPTGAIITNLDGIREAYETGRGIFKMRAKVSVESVGPRKLGLVITELPYLVGPEKVIEKIKDGVNSKKLQGISDVTDLTDRTNGLKLVVGLKTGFDPAAVLELLYKFTPLEESFGINNVTLVAGRPATLGLRDLLGVYLAHRVLVTRRRSKNRLGKKQARLHLLEGLLVAIADIDKVIAVIRNSEEVEEARNNLQTTFGLSEAQAEYILELRLRRLTKFSRIELETESATLRQEIADLERILANDQALRTVVSEELGLVAEKFGDSRRSVLLSESGEIKPLTAAKAMTMDAELADQPCGILLTASGLLGRLSEEEFGQTSSRRKKHDAVRSRVLTTTRSDLLFVTSKGRALRIHAADVPPATSNDHTSFVTAADFLGVRSDEQVLCCLDANEARTLALGTKQGVVKRVLPDYPSKEEFEVISLKDNDEVIGAALTNDTDFLVFVTAQAQLLHYSASNVRPQGRPAGGMAGISLDESDRVVFFGSYSPESDSKVVTVANFSGALAGVDPGSIKLSAISEFPIKGRATGGVRAHKFLKGEDQLALAFIGASPAAIGKSGSPVELPESLSKRDASGDALNTPIVFIGENIESLN